MIKTAADFLNALRLREAHILNEQQIKHPGIIGQMYEGLTKELLGRALPSILDFQVVSGLIENNSGTMSKQIDCMLVRGQGRKIPHSNEFIFNINDVIAVLEVKKNLYSSELKSGYQNLLSVTNITTPKPISLSLLSDAFCSITGFSLPLPHEVSKLPFHIQMIYHSLVVESYQPLRIIIGYNGFSTEFALRESLLDFVGRNTGKRGFGPARLPSLIICDSLSLIKLNGMPYNICMTDDYWIVYGSCSCNPLLLLLELLFTRLTYIHGLSNTIFGDDLEYEFIKPLLAGKCIQHGDVYGWLYNAIELSQSVLEEVPDYKRWVPEFLDICESTVIIRLCTEGPLEANSESLEDFVSSHGYTREALIQRLREKRLATREDDKIVLLCDGCEVVFMSDGRAVAADNRLGKLTRWVLRNDPGGRNSNNRRQLTFEIAPDCG